MMGLRLGKLGKLGAVGRAIASLQSQLWPLGAASPGMWIAPRYVDDSFQDSAGTTALSAIGTVLDTSNPIGLILDRKTGLELGPELVAGTPTNYGSSTVSVAGDLITVTSTGGGTSGVTWLDSVVGAAGRYKLTFELVGNPQANNFQCYPNTQSNPVVYIAPLPGVFESFPAVVASGDGNNHPVITVPAMPVGNTFTIRLVSVREIPGIHLSQGTSAARAVMTARKNELVGTAALATQNVTSKALQYVLSFWGTGTVTLSGTSTAGPLVGTGTGNRVSLTFTPTAGTLTLTVSGTVTDAQLEVVV